MAAPDPTMDDPNAPAGDTAGDTDQPDLSNGYTIEIKVSGSGDISVSVEPGAEEASEEGAEEGGSGGEDENAQSVPNIGAALKLAREIYTHAGTMGTDTEGENQMAAGYQ